MTYVGTYYPGIQSLDALWGAISNLVRRQESDAPRVRLVGERSEVIMREMARFDIGTQVEETGFLPHDQVLREIAKSDLLVACGPRADDPVSRGIIPAKLFEYLASNRPILYLGHAGGDAARLLEGQAGCHVIDPADEVGVMAVLEAERNSSYDRDLEPLSRQVRTRELAGTLDKAVG